MRVSNESFLQDTIKGNFEGKILPLRERGKVINRWRTNRIQNLLPKLMNEEDLDMWIVIAREYNEDPAMLSLLPAEMTNARRRTILLFNKKADGTIEYMALSRPGSGLDHLYSAVWTKAVGQEWGKVFKIDDSSPDASPMPETQWECLHRIVKSRDPKKIGINISHTSAFGDGLSVSLHNELKDALGEEYSSRLVSAENLCVRWIETRTDDELAAYSGIMQMAHSIIAEGFSSKVILPGVTTSQDVSWWMIQRMADLGLQDSFGSYVWIIREGKGNIFSDEIIMPGDVLHCDVGICYLGLHTDTQENAYVLKLDETDVPKGFKDAMAEGNKLQDILMSQMIEDKTGNEILAESRRIAIEQGMKPCIYTHPIGPYVHGAGPTIGLFDMQQGVVGQGDFKLHNNTLYAMELNTGVTIPEWNNEESTMFLETNILFKDNRVYCIGGRQENWHLVK